jgi:hypothetical protein
LIATNFVKIGGDLRIWGCCRVWFGLEERNEMGEWRKKMERRRALTSHWNFTPLLNGL